MTNRKKLFFENFFVYGFGKIIDRIIPLLLLPVITRLLPNSFYFGLYDISNVLVSFGSAFALMGMYDALFRLLFEFEDNQRKKELCSSAFFIVTTSGMIMFLLFFIFRENISNTLFDSNDLGNLVILCGITIYLETIKNVLVAPTRFLNQRKLLISVNSITTITSYVISIILIYKGLYIYALPIGRLISAIVTFTIYLVLNHRWFNLKNYRLHDMLQLMKIGMPLVLVFLYYWIFSSFDRIMITQYLSVAAVGVYSVGAKLASTSQLLNAAFAGGWQYFTFSTMKDDDHVEVISKVFEYITALSIIMFFWVTPFSKTIVNMLFTNEFIEAAKVFPYLFMSPLLLMIYQTVSSQLLVIKNTWLSSLVLVIGVIINLVLNFILIPILGIEGAAIATLLGYLTSTIAIVIITSNKRLLIVSKRSISLTIIAIVVTLLQRILLSDFLIALFFSFIMILVVLYFYRIELKEVYSLINRKQKGDKNEKTFNRD